MKNFSIALLKTLMPLYVFAQKSEEDYCEAFNLIEIWMDAQKDYDMLPGISASAVKGDEVIWSGAFDLANKKTGLSFSTETLGSICSISKLFTSVAIMKLYDDGKLRLDDRIEDLLPWYNLEQRFTASRLITVRSLLTHSAGFAERREYAILGWHGISFPGAGRDY